MKAAIGNWVWEDRGDSYGWYPPAGAVSCPDFRALPDQALQGIYGDWSATIFLFEGAVPSDYDFLGSGRLDELWVDEWIKTVWHARFGMVPVGDTVADAIAWQLTEGGSVDGSVPAPVAIPDTRMGFDLWLPVHSRVSHRRFQRDNLRGSWESRALARTRADLVRLTKESRDLVKRFREAAQQERKTSQGDGARSDALADHWNAVPERVLGGLTRQWFGRHNDPRFREFLTAHDADFEPQKPETAYSDNFDRANNDSLGASWTEVVGDLDILTNRVINGSTADNHWARYGSALSTENHYCQITYAVEGGGANPDQGAVGPVVRSAAAATTGYYGYRRRFNTPGTGTAKFVAAAWTSLATSATTGNVPQIPLLTIAGNSLTLTVGGAAGLGPTVDTAITGNVQCGIYIRGGTSAGTGQAGDDWSCSDSPSGAAWHYRRQQEIPR